MILMTQQFLKMCYCQVITNAPLAYDYAGTITKPNSREDLGAYMTFLTDDEQYVVQREARDKPGSVRVAMVLESMFTHQARRYSAGFYMAIAIRLPLEKPASKPTSELAGEPK